MSCTKWLFFFLISPFLAVLSAVLNQFLANLIGNAASPWPWHWDPMTFAMAISPVGAVLIAIPVVLFEAHQLGYNNSSLKRIWEGDPSARVDLFHVFLYVSNLKNIFGILFSLGIGHFLYFWVQEHAALHLLEGANFASSLLLLTFVNSFLFYWIHRVMHSRLFWPAHVVHHSASSFNLITNFRNHPINITVEMIIYSISAAFLGASFSVTLAYLILNGIYQLLAHSNFRWNLYGTPFAFAQEWLLLAPEEHRIHHSKNPEHWNKNYGLTPFWDKIFGTWQDSRSVTAVTELGIQDEDDQQLMGSFKGIFVVAKRFATNAIGMCRL